jgi:hypothetical protein
MGLSCPTFEFSWSTLTGRTCLMSCCDGALSPILSEESQPLHIRPHLVVQVKA